MMLPDFSHFTGHTAKPIKTAVVYQEQMQDVFVS